VSCVCGGASSVTNLRLFVVGCMHVRQGKNNSGTHSLSSSTFDRTGNRAKYYKRHIQLHPLICSAPRPTAHIAPTCQPLIMDRARAFAVIAVATAFHLLAASAELALTLAGHQQPAAPATDDQDAAAMSGERLPFVAAHHLASWVHTPLPWVGSGPGADGTKTNSQEQLAMQASSSLPQLLDDHNE